MPHLTLTKDIFPNIDLKDIGKKANIGYGAVDKITTHCIVGGATTLLTANITSSQTSFDVKDASRFPSAPFTIQLGDEKMRVTAKTVNTFSSITRGYEGTTAKAHLLNKTVFEVRIEYVYLIAQHPVKSIGEIYIDGIHQLTGFTKYTGQTGSEHTDWPGKSVIAFSADSYIGKQRNLDITDVSGITIIPAADKYSSVNLIDGDDATYQTTALTLKPAGASAWQASTVYSLNTLVVPVTQTGYYYQVTTAGTSGGTEPTWPTTEGATVVNGTVTFACKGKVIPYPSAWVSFPAGTGSIIKQTYEAIVANDENTQREIRAIIVNMDTGAVVGNTLIAIPANTKITFQIEQSAGTWNTQFFLQPVNSHFKIYAMGKTVLRYRSALDDETDNTINYNPPPVYCSHGQIIDDIDVSYITLKYTALIQAWVSYPSTSLGAIYNQTHYAKVKAVSDSKVKILSVTNQGLTAVSEETILANVEKTISLDDSDGSWETVTKLILITGELRVFEIYKTVSYISDKIVSAGVEAATSSAQIVIGDVIIADIEGYKDDGSGTYTGTANALIERPDHVIKHFIDVPYGFALADIDTASFSTAGSSYASAISGGYKFAFVINEEITPSKFLAGMAFQCRSIIKYEGGKWYLNYLPDTAPSAVKTISKSELAGQFKKFKFNETSRMDIVNALTATFQKNYGKLNYDESDWIGTAVTSDATSQGEYGIRRMTYEFGAVRLQAMTDHVLAFIKLQRKNPLLLIEFPIFWEHFNLERGDTFDIVNDLHNGKKFYIEKVERLTKGQVQITGIGWP